MSSVVYSQRSHQATKLEKQKAKKGELLKFFPGRLLKKHPHNSCFRRKGAHNNQK